ncbi:unnamed protein product [Ixodes pacificus]
MAVDLGAPNASESRPPVGTAPTPTATPTPSGEPDWSSTSGHPSGQAGLVPLTTPISLPGMPPITVSASLPPDALASLSSEAAGGSGETASKAPMAAPQHL